MDHKHSGRVGSTRKACGVRPWRHELQARSEWRSLGLLVVLEEAGEALGHGGHDVLRPQHTTGWPASKLGIYLQCYYTPRPQPPRPGARRHAAPRPTWNSRPMPRSSSLPITMRTELWHRTKMKTCGCGGGVQGGKAQSYAGRASGMHDGTVQHRRFAVVDQPANGQGSTAAAPRTAEQSRASALSSPRCVTFCRKGGGSKGRRPTGPKVENSRIMIL